MHDIDYAYTRGNPEYGTNVKKSWIHFQKDGYNSSLDFEWLSSRFGVYSGTIDMLVFARGVDNNGNQSLHNLNITCGARPVFYLSSKAKIASGDGTKNNPYILDVQE